ncbi:Xylose import ATP-binding protein XylG [Aedoeadaptatus ivorii]|uniref:Xylose import ATP-binding protein XylG n=1 Tax=Aedoeadaptatus ivorii TaxID=54006 RepID=A0A3S4YKD9_9FIRM|nr:ABC transporter ATP-binding protein [Peptoniphilus ivorii]VEJ35119.1 Xylose import ATP-binding protein XylG [Peptoniphilus ivorii]
MVERQNAPAVEMRGITKKFGDFVANDTIDLVVEKGEIHALLGENGAGKSTLMNVLYGLYAPTEGAIRIHGKPVDFRGPKDAIEAGLGMVHQHFMLFEPFTVVENIILGEEPTKGVVLDKEEARRRVMELSDRYGLKIDPDDRIENISVGMQQRVEILKALYRDADILIFDEPTAVLTPQEIEELIKILRSLAEEGKSIIIITHKLGEIKALAERCTIIRRGKWIDTVDVASTSEEALAEKMVGREIAFSVYKKPMQLGEEFLKVEGLRVKDFRGVEKLRGLNLEVRKGEIFGIAGVDGNGQSELLEALTGLRPIEGGKIFIGGKDMTQKSPKEIRDAGMNNIPEDRNKRGLVQEFSVAENMILHRFHEMPYAKGGILQDEAIRTHAQGLMESYDIRPRRSDYLAGELSGGNQQKVILAREIDDDPEILIAAQPTRGLDVGAIEYIHKFLVEQRDRGKAVLLVSFELEEVMSLSDRIGILYEGQITKIFRDGEADEKELGYYMAGGKDHE